MGELINQWTSVSTSTKSTQATCDQNKSQNRQQKNGVLDRTKILSPADRAKEPKSRETPRNPSTICSQKGW